jgi:hypothetical protein
MAQQSTDVLTGKQRPPLKPEQVKLSHIPPHAAFEVIGTVTSSAPGRGQQNADDARAELKKQAAQMGANWIILDRTHRSEPPPFSGTNNVFTEPGTHLSGQAIYVPSS